MFLDYRKAIAAKPLKSIAHNPAVIEFFNKNAPNGTRYVPSLDGSLILAGDCSMTLGGLRIVLSVEQKAVLGDNPSIQNVIEYLDNSQEPIDLEPIKDGYIIINGEEISIEKIRLSPFNNVLYQHGKFQLIPQPIQPFEIDISGNGIIKKIKMQRIPTKSVTQRIFESVEDDVLELTYVVDAKSLSFTFSYLFNIDKANSAKEIYDTYNFIYGVSIGNGNIGTVKLDNGSCTQDEKEHFKALTEVWRKISLIEEQLNMKLVPLKKGEVNINIQLVEILYQSLINQQPIKRNWEINNIDVSKKVADINMLNKFKDGLYFFSFNDKEEIELLGIHLTIPRIAYATELAIVDIEDSGDIYKISFEKGKSTIFGVIYFATEEDRDSYIKNINPQQIVMNTKPIDDFLSKQ